jgi:hypothetical protein
MKNIDPHLERGLDTESPYVSKRPVEGQVVCVLDAWSERRGMKLEPHSSRAVTAGEIHELAVTDDPAARPEARVDRVAYVGFVEIVRGGVILVGDRVTLGQRELGKVVGFNCTHFPNHMNILVRSVQWQTGRGLGVALEEPAVFIFPQTPTPDPG